MPITAPDTRKLQLIIREGEQHDLYQFVGDFFELYGMSANSVGGMVAEVNKRLAGRIMFIIIFALRRMEPSGIPSPPPLPEVSYGYVSLFIECVTIYHLIFLMRRCLLLRLIYC